MEMLQVQTLHGMIGHGLVMDCLFPFFFLNYLYCLLCINNPGFLKSYCVLKAAITSFVGDIRCHQTYKSHK